MKKRLILICLVMVLCFSLGTSHAHTFEEISVGMGQDDVIALLQEYELAMQTKYYLEYSDQENRIQINLRDGKVSKTTMWIDGRKDSDLDLLHPDWNMSEKEALETLKSNHLYYWFCSDGILFTSSAKKNIRYYRFYGKLGTNPADYTLIFSDDGLETISVRSVDSSKTLFEYVSWVDCLTKELGHAEDAWAPDDIDMDYDEEDSLLLFLSEYTKWTHSGNRYELGLVTTIAKKPEDESYRYEKKGYDIELTISRNED
ncbi:MAG: hypothetical protein IKE15_09320 [Clostridia bacterium]|nr:hypothetical protein [Clostridia bacterium]